MRRSARSLRPTAGSASLLLTSLLTFLFLGGCAKRPYYAGFMFDSPILVESDRSDMVLTLDWILESKRLQKLTMITPDKGTQSLYPRDETSPGTTDWLPLPVLFAAQYVLQKKFRGLEVDLLTKTEAEGFTPVSAIHDLDGSVRIEMGPSFRDFVPADARPVDRTELAQRYGIGEIVDGEREWRPLELFALQQALSLLGKEELAVLRGVSFVRNRRAEEDHKGTSRQRIWAQYRGRVALQGAAKKEPRQIELFDTKIDKDELLFIGEPSQPYPMTTMALLHEIGHAVADYPRIVTVRPVLALIDERDQLVKEWNGLLHRGKLTEERKTELDQRMAELKRLQEEALPALVAIRKSYDRDAGPIHADYRAARGPDKGPTRYGRTDIEESFAESFALAKADPSALRRIYPDLVEWFQTSGHLAALRPYLPALEPQQQP